MFKCESTCGERIQDHISSPSAPILDFRGKTSLPIKNQKDFAAKCFLFNCFLFKVISAIAIAIAFSQAFHVTSHWLNWCFISNSYVTKYVFQISFPVTGNEPLQIHKEFQFWKALCFKE